MRKEFLKEIAEIFINKYGDDISHFCFVFPNRRSSLFFSKYLGHSSKHPIFSPALVTINDLLTDISGLENTDRITLMYYLYRSYSKYITNYKEGFDEFIFWGDMLLNDFDDVDKYLADPSKVFLNIKELSEIKDNYSYLSDNQRDALTQFWGNFIPFKENEKEQSFLSIWNYLFDIYKDFNKSLLAEGRGYEGMIYRNVAQKENYPTLDKYEKIVFVGLNALNKCEKKFLDTLRNDGRGDFYWDYFGSIIKDPRNKSSLFMNDNFSRYPSIHPFPTDGGGVDMGQEIEVIGVPSAVGQTKLVTKILEQLIDSPDENKLFSTAIVLPDEQLLIPLLNSIPEKIDKINVTMGFKLSNSNTATFVSFVSSLQQKIKVSNQQSLFYHKSVLDLLSHPFCKGINSDLILKIRNDILKNNMVYVHPNLFKGDDLLEKIFIPVSTIYMAKSEMIEAVSSYQLDILSLLQSSVSAIEREFIYHYCLSINKIVNLKIEMELGTYFRLLDRMAASISIPFSGEPLSGLQVMGPLETRALDFENLIILSVNEGVFPSKSVSTSFIPYNIRKGFDLPTYEFQDSISAYHFYRSIYRAKKIFLIYDSRGDSGIKSSEESRYIKQLKYHHHLPIRESSVMFKAGPSRIGKSISVEKTPLMLSNLENTIFSYSSINTYLNCPLAFYYRYVEGMREADSVAEEVKSDTFGLLLHRLMENIYSPYLNSEVDKAEIKKIIKNIDLMRDNILSSFKSTLGVDKILGKNKIIQVILEKYATKILKCDEEFAPFRYLYSEKKIFTTLPICDGKRKITLLCVVDRIDIVEGKIRIIDYKTGSVTMQYSLIQDLFDVNRSNRAFTAFQMIFYLFVLSHSQFIKGGADVNLVVYPLKTIFRDNLSSFTVSQMELNSFETELTTKIEEIFNPDIDFKGTNNPMICSNCPFIIICNK